MSDELATSEADRPTDSGTATGTRDAADSTDSTTGGRRLSGGDAAADTTGASNHEDGIADDADRPRVSTVLSITAVAFAVAALALQPTYAIPGALLGAIGVAFAVVKRRRPVLGSSVALALLFVVLHGAMGGGALGTVAAAGLFVFAWDQADNAFDLDAHLGPDATVVRGEIAHALYSFGVVALAGGGVYVTALLAANQRPLPALVLLLLGAILLAAAIRDH